MRRLTGFLMVLALTTFALGCSKKHDDAIPSPLGVGTQQTITNFSITNPQNFDYDLMWSVANQSEVRHYRVYASFDGFQYTLVDTTASPTFLVQSFLPVVSFGVSIVNTGGIEGALVTKVAP